MKTIDGELKAVLHMQVNSADIEACWMEGYADAESGLEEASNPFEQGTLAHDQWLEGWWAGFYGEAPLYPEYAMESRAVAMKHQQSTASNDAPLSANDSEQGFWKRFVMGLSVTVGVCLIGAGMIEELAA